MTLRQHRKRRLLWQGKWTASPAICKLHTTLASVKAHGGGFVTVSVYARMEARA